MNQNIANLLAVLQSKAPDIKGRLAVLRLVDDAQQHGASDADIEKMLAQTLSDGLTYGNWPWETPAQVAPPQGMMNASEYADTLNTLKNAHLEDLINLITASLAERDDVTTVSDYKTDYATFTIPAVQGDSGVTYPPRPFSVTIQEPGRE